MSGLDRHYPIVFPFSESFVIVHPSLYFVVEQIGGGIDVAAGGTGLAIQPPTRGDKLEKK